MVNSELYIKNLSNKQPTKDITVDDIKYKIPKSTSKKEIEIKISKDVIFSKKISQLLLDQME